MTMALTRQEAEVALYEELGRQSIILDHQLQQLNNHLWQLQQQFAQGPVDEMPQWLPLGLLQNFPMLGRVALLSGAPGRLLVEEVRPQFSGIKPLQNLADLPEVAMVMPYLLHGQAKEVVLKDGGDFSLLSIYPLASKNGQFFFATWLIPNRDNVLGGLQDMTISLQLARHAELPAALPDGDIRASKVLVAGEQRYRLTLVHHVGPGDIRPHLYLPVLAGLLLLLVLFVQAAYPAKRRPERSTV